MGEELSADSPRGWDGGVHAAVEKEPVRGGGRDHVCHCPHDAALPVGKALLPMEGIGKVRTGQRVIIRLPAFPEQEFNHRGKGGVRLPVPDEQGRFVLEIALPQGLTTRYGKELPLIKTMTGTASIVTKEKSLLSRLLNLK